MNRYFEVNEAGCNVRCKIYYNDLRSIRRVVLYLHGFGGHKDNRAAEKFAERVLTKYKGIAVITYNFPCHGDDVRKKFSLADCGLYLRLVVEYIQREYTDEIYAYGTSFGGYLVLKYLAEHGSPFRKIALRCPAIEMYKVFSQGVMTPEDHEKLLKGKDIPVGFDRKVMIGESFLNDLKAFSLFDHEFLDWADDILILHGTADEIVPMADSVKFADDNVILCVPIEGADHRFRNPDHMETATKQILAFYEF